MVKNESPPKNGSSSGWWASVSLVLTLLIVAIFWYGRYWQKHSMPSAYRARLELAAKDYERIVANSDASIERLNQLGSEIEIVSLYGCS